MPNLTAAFFQRDVLDVARDLVGVELHWQGCSGRIVETEAYAVEGDPACHTATRPSSREFVRVHAPGTAYVYLNYGMYWLFNLLVKGGPRDGLVLIRALEPHLGIDAMQQRRRQSTEAALCSGPGKIGQSLDLSGADHGTPLVGRSRPAHARLVKSSRATPFTVTADVRVGIQQAADFPWRFLATDHPHVSVPAGKVRPPSARPIPRKRRT